MHYNFDLLVSVITPCYNGSRFLTRLIETVKIQNVNLEHIIVDDCSTDDSWNILVDLAAKYSWLRVFRLDINRGPIEARNYALKNCKGRYLSFLDVDDYWMPNKLATQINFMHNQNIAFSFSDYRFVSEDGSFVGRKLVGLNSIGWNLHHMTRYLGCLTVVLDRELIGDFLFPDVSREIRAEDFLAWSSIISKGFDAKRCPYDLARYTVVKNSRSSNRLLAALSVWKVYRQVEGISLLVSIIYFFNYLFFVSFKKVFYRPIFEIQKVDTD